MASTKERGDRLERTVGKHYEALGFKVTPNVSINGHQVDLLAAKYVSGASTFTLMIEVKARTKSAIGVNEVTPFVNTATALINAAAIQGAVLVTDSDFSKEAQAALRGRPGLRLLSLEDLEHDLFNYSEALLRMRHEYEISPIFREYIKLEGKAKGSKKNIPDVAAYILKWSRTRGSRFIVLVGDFGSGKSTILDRIAYEQAVERLARADALYPVVLRLRRLLQYPDLWAFISASLRDAQMIAPPRAEFWAQLTSGRLLVLLDGFDEVHTGASAADRAMYLKRLAPLLVSGSPCVLSTRPLYFESFEEMVRLLGRELNRSPVFRRIPELPVEIDVLVEKLGLAPPEALSKSDLKTFVRLEQLTEEKIVEYLKKYEAELRTATGASVREVLRFLYRIYDLEDLMRRPLLLQMVVMTLGAGKVNLADTALTCGPSTLYDLYTQGSVKRDLAKQEQGRVQLLSEVERLQVCRQVAFAMLKKGTIELTATEVSDAIVATRLRPLVEASRAEQAGVLERVLTDVRICTFLSGGEDGSLRFSHTSFFEFFVAQLIVLRCRESPRLIVDFAGVTLPKNILYFLGSFARDLEWFGATLLAAIRQTSEGWAGGRVSNLLHRIVFSSGTLLKDLALAKAHIEDVELRRASVRGFALRDSVLVDFTARDVTAERWSWESCKLRSGVFASVEIVDSRMALRADEVVFEHLQARNCELEMVGDGWALQDSTITKGRAIFEGSGLLRKVNVENTSIKFGEVRLAIDSSVSFSECMVTTRDEESWYSVGAEIRFDRCVLNGVRIEDADVFALAKMARDVETRVGLRGCRGIVFVPELQANYGPKLRRMYPNIKFVDLGSLGEALRQSEERGKPSELDPSSRVLLTEMVESMTVNALRAGDSELLRKVTAAARL